MRVALGSLLLLFVVAGCRPTVFIPKPPGYYKIDTPQAHVYKTFDDPAFPFTFEYPVYSRISQDSAVSDVKDPESKFWINIFFPELGGIINVTYKSIRKDQPLDKLNAEAYEMSFFHHEKAAFIDHNEMTTPAGNSCLLYTIGGNVATRYQFTATDAKLNFIRGALYFDVTPNADSLKPASDFIMRDVEHMLWTLKWRTTGK
jgi:gliding motility-associated lipoprotein GldD